MIALITSIIPAEWLAGLGALLAALVGVWITGRRSGAVRAGKRDLKQYQDTRKAIDDVDKEISDDPAVLRDWLEQRGMRDGNKPKRPL